MVIGMSEGYFQRNESFDVVLCKKDVNPMTAKPEDFKRVAIMAPEPSLAGDDDEVKKIVGDGYRQVEVVATGRPSDHETMARHRAANAE